MNPRATEAYPVDDENLVTEPIPNRGDVLNLIYASISEVNLHLPEGQRLDPSANTALFGDGGKLDSMSLANFIIILEQKLEERFGIGIDLTQDDPFSPTTGHFQTVACLMAYISASLQR